MEQDHIIECNFKAFGYGDCDQTFSDDDEHDLHVQWNHPNYACSINPC